MSNLSFLHPYILWLFLALPLLWYLFQAVPPNPKKLWLPTARFLADLTSEESKKEHLPWWVKLLRILLFAFVIIAAAGPYIKPNNETPITKNAIGIIYDNSWASATYHEEQKNKALHLISIAEQQRKNVLFIETVPKHKKIGHLRLLTPFEAQSAVKQLQAYPWKANHANLLAELKENETKLKDSAEYHWLGHGLNDDDIYSTVSFLNNFGSVTYYQGDKEQAPLIITAPQNKKSTQSHKYIQVEGAFNRKNKDLKLYTKDKFANTLNFITLPIGFKQNADIDISELWDGLEESSHSAPSYLQLSYKKHAGSVWVLPQNILKQRVGILAHSDTIKKEESPLIQSIYYISKAVEGKAPYTIDKFPALKDWGASLIIVPENYALSQDDVKNLEDWVESGGTLLRFPPEKADNSLTSSKLMPIELLDEERSVAGRLDWQEPLSLGSIPDESPLFGLKPDDQLAIKKQVLAVPNAQQDMDVWAIASDGTPLITAQKREAGQIILIHTQAKPGWSNLPLTGFFINMLHRVIDISAGARISINKNDITDTTNSTKEFSAHKLIDATGALIDPPLNITAVDIGKIKNSPLSYDLWPGIYRSKNEEIILNLGEKITSIQNVNTSKLKADVKDYTFDKSVNLLPYLIFIILMIFLLEWLIIAFINGLDLKSPQRLAKKTAVTSLAILCTLALFSTTSKANDDDHASRANALNLAYIKSNNPIIDGMAQKGLGYVANALNQRTALQNVRATGVDLANDQLAFYPLLYWPFNGSKELSKEEYRKLNAYINSGGMLFVDLRNGRPIDSALYNQNSPLIQLGNNISVPLLSKLPTDHVLRKSYYLISRDKIEGRYKNGDIWLDTGSQNTATQNNQYVATLLIGSNDWIGIWSDENADIYEREMALRFAVNLVMYALTGTYKQDQVHTKAILDRLNQRQQRLNAR